MTKLGASRGIHLVRVCGAQNAGFPLPYRCLGLGHFDIIIPGRGGERELCESFVFLCVSAEVFKGGNWEFAVGAGSIYGEP